MYELRITGFMPCFYPWLHEYDSAGGNIQENKFVYSGALQSERFCPLISEASESANLCLAEREGWNPYCQQGSEVCLPVGLCEVIRFGSRWQSKRGGMSVTTFVGSVH